MKKEQPLDVLMSETGHILYNASGAARVIGKSYNTIIKWSSEYRMTPFAYLDGSPIFTEQEITKVKEEVDQNDRPMVRTDLAYKLLAIYTKLRKEKELFSLPEDLWSFVKTIDAARFVIETMLQFDNENDVRQFIELKMKQST